MKTENMTFRQFILLFTAQLFGFLWAQEVNFTTRVSRSDISADERIKVEFSANVNFENFTPPRFDDFYVLMGPMQSTNYSWINGRQSFNKSYSYILQPKKTGTLTIGAASMVYKGKTYRTQPVQVHVSEGVPPPNPRQNNIQPSVSKGANGKDIFLRMDLSTQSAYVNQAVGVIFRLYVKDGVKVGDLNMLEIPRYEGFWVENVSNDIQGPISAEIDDIPYHYYNLRKVVIFPQQAGKLKITSQSFRINRYVQKEEDWGIFRQIVEVPEPVVLSTGSRFIHVKPLPENGKPENFNEAVGQFKIKVEADKINLKTGEPLTVRITVSGTGNLGMFDLPALNLPPDLEVYEPEHKKRTKATLAGINGSITDIYTIIPHKSGKYKIPAIAFSYFDPKRQQYITLTSEPIDLEVSGGTITPSNDNTTLENPNDTFRYIHTGSSWLPVRKQHFFGSKRFYIPVVLLLFLFPIAWGLKKWYDRYYSDTARLETLRAEKEWKHLLNEAEKLTGNQETFYAMLEKALKSFLAARLQMPASSITKANVLKTLKTKNLSAGLTEKLENIWNRLEMARYSPLQATGRENLLREVKDWIKHTDKNLKA